VDVDDDGVDIAMARGDVMQSFTIGVGHRWWTQVFRRNPLVRRSDRIEVLVLGFAVVHRRGVTGRRGHRHLRI